MKKLPARSSLADEVAAELRREIIAGRLVQGQRLVEMHLAESLGVSRGPIREAFKFLKAEGLVFEEPNRGTFVVSLSTADVGEIYEVRLAVETRSVKLITRAARQADIHTLQKKAQQLIAAAAVGQQQPVARADVEFHETICRLSGVGRLHQVFVQHMPLLQSLLLIDEHLYPVLADPRDEHSGIVRAIEAGDVAQAASTIEAHLEGSWSRLKTYLDGTPKGE